jgi:hypothetical protein
LRKIGQVFLPLVLYGAKKMNMISTGAFIDEMDASSKQDTLVSKLVSAWEKKNSKTARAGGVSLMALSLAACGSSDDDAVSYTQAQLDLAKTTATADGATAALKDASNVAHASVDAAITSNDTTVTADAKTAALTHTDNTVYASVDAAFTAGSNQTNAVAVAAALKDANNVTHNNVDAAITSNDATITTNATNAAETSLLSAASSGFATVAALQAAYNTATAPNGAKSVSYTTGTDLLTALTTSNDTITGAYGSVADADIVVDVNSTDSDVANLTVADASNLTVSGVETVNIDVRDTNVTSSVVLDKVVGATDVVLTSSYGSTTMVADKVGDGQKVTFNDTEFTTIGVNAGGSTDGASNDAHLVLKGKMTATLTTAVRNNDVDGLIIETSGGASTVTMTAADDFIASTAAGSLDTEFVTGRGDSNLTLVVDQTTNATGFDGAIVNNEMTGAATLTVKMDGGVIESAEVDLSQVAADTIVIADVTSGTAGNLKVASGAVLESGVAEALEHATAITSATAGGSVTHNIKHADSNTDIVLTYTSFGTVNLAMTGTAATVMDDDIRTTYTGIGNSTDLNIATGSALLTLGTIQASASNTLDAVTVTGGKDLTTETITANSLKATVEDLVVGDLVIVGATDITASKSVTGTGVDHVTANTGSLTVNAGTGITFADGLGRDNATTIDLGAISLTSTAGAISVEAANTDSTITLSAAAAAQGVTASAALTAVGNISVVAGGTANLAAVAGSGLLDVTANVIDLNGATAGSTITLSATSTTTNSTFDGALTGNVVFNGNGVTYASVTNDEDITGNVTVQGGASLSMTAGSEILTGAVTHTGSGTVAIQDLGGTYSGGTATGAVTIDDTASGASIVTGSGNDSITTGNVAVQISTNGGNDTVNAAVVGAAKQTIIDTGAGIDTITGGLGTTDQLTGGSGTDTFKYTAASHGSTNENIKDFTVGSAGDVFHITDDTFDGSADTIVADGASVTKIDTSDASTTSTNALGILLLTGASYADTTAVIAAIDGSSGIVETTATGLDNEDAIIIYNDNAGADAGVKFAFLTGDADWSANGATALSVVASLDGLTFADITNLTADNFVIA